MLRLANDRSRTADLAFRVDQLRLFQPRSAFFALVAARFEISTDRTRPFDVPVGEEHAVGFAVKLLLAFLDENFLAVKLEEEFLAGLVMYRQARSRIIVETHSELFEAIFVHRVVAVNNLLGRHAFFIRGDRDWNAVFIRTADKDYVFALQAEIPDIDVSRQVCAGKMSEMDRTVCVWKCRCNKSSRKFRLQCFTVNDFVSDKILSRFRRILRTNSEARQHRSFGTVGRCDL